MQNLRKFICWIFAATSLLYVLYPVHQLHVLPFLRSLLIAPPFSVVVGAISGAAWWTIWKGKASAGGWAIAASLMHILIFLRQFVIPLQPVWGYHVGALAIGTVGLVAFLWRETGDPR